MKSRDVSDMAVGILSTAVQTSWTTTSQKREVFPRRARIQVSWTFASLNSWLESNKEEKKKGYP